MLSVFGRVAHVVGDLGPDAGHEGLDVLGRKRLDPKRGWGVRGLPIFLFWKVGLGVHGLPKRRTFSEPSAEMPND